MPKTTVPPADLVPVETDAEFPEYIPNTEDAATEVANKLAVVITLVEAIEHIEDGGIQGEDAGWYAYTAIDLLKAHQGLLRKSVAQAEAERAKAVQS